MGRFVFIVAALSVSLRVGYAETPKSEVRRDVPAVPTGMVEIVLDTDAFNEVDDQFAIAFAARSTHKIRMLFALR